MSLKYLDKRLVTSRIEKSGLSRVTRTMTRALVATQRMLGTTSCISRVLRVVAKVSQGICDFFYSANCLSVTPFYIRDPSLSSPF